MMDYIGWQALIVLITQLPIPSLHYTIYGLTHPSEECDWAPASPTSSAHSSASMRVPKRTANPQVCISWNHSAELSCPYPNCRYQHICLYCARDPQVYKKTTKPSTAAATAHTHQVELNNTCPNHLKDLGRPTTTVTSHTNPTHSLSPLLTHTDSLIPPYTIYPPNLNHSFNYYMTCTGAPKKKKGQCCCNCFAPF